MTKAQRQRRCRSSGRVWRAKAPPSTAPITTAPRSRCPRRPTIRRSRSSTAWSSWGRTKVRSRRSSTPRTADRPNELIELVPDDALGMYAVEHLDAAIADQVGRIAASDPQADQELKRLSVTGPAGLLSQLTGDVAAAASPEQGTIPVGGVLMVGTNDPAATSKWLDDTLQTLPLGATAASCSSNGGCRSTHEATRWATESHGL